MSREIDSAVGDEADNEIYIIYLVDFHKWLCSAPEAFEKGEMICGIFCFCWQAS